MQACCCCGDLNISVKYVFAFDGVLDTAEYSFTSCMHCYCHWSSSITTLVYIRIYFAVRRNKFRPNKCRMPHQLAIQQILLAFCNRHVLCISRTFGCYLPIVIFFCCNCNLRPECRFEDSCFFLLPSFSLNLCLNPVIYC